MPYTSPPVPGWWHRTWPVVALGVLSIVMWVGRIRNIVGDDDLAGFGRAFRLVLALSFIVGGAVVLAACRQGYRSRNWRVASRREPEGWRVGPGLPAWGIKAAVIVAGWTAVVWTIQGVGILIDPNYDSGFKAVHTFLMVGSLIVAGTAAWGLRRNWPVAPPSRVA